MALQQFTANALRFLDFIEEQRPGLKLVILPNDDGSLELTKSDGTRYYPMLLQMREDTTAPSHIGLVIQVGNDTVKLLRQTEVLQWIEDCQTWLELFHLKEFPLTDRARFLNGLDSLCKGKLTSGEVAEFLNAYIVELLREHEQLQELYKASPLPADETWRVLEAQGYNTMAKVHAYQMLDWMMLGGEANNLIEYGLENIREGREITFAPGQPIDGQRVRNRVKAWRAESGAW